MLSIFLNSLCLLSHLLSPLFKPKHHSPPNINITHHSSSFFLWVTIRVVFCVLVFYFILFFLLWPMLKGRGGYGWVSRLLRLVMGLVEIDVLPLASLPKKAKILLLNLLALSLRIAKGLPHPKSLSYIENLGELPIVIIAPSKFPNRKSLGSLSQSLTSWCTVSLSCATTFLCRLTGFGGDRHGFGVARFLVFYCEAGLFFFYMHFCSDGILVGSGQWAMVAWWAWWRCDGGDWAVEARW